MPKKNALSSQEQRRAYKNVLPTTKAISGFKLNMAIQNEKDAVLTLRNMKHAPFILILPRDQRLMEIGRTSS